MKYTPEEVLLYLKEEDVKFVRMSFCDPFGRQKNVAIMADELPRAFEYGIGFDASAIDGFNGEVRSDLFLQPDPSTLVELPWRPQQGGVARLFCDITHPDGSPFEADTRYILKKSVEAAKEKGIGFFFGSEIEFYLFRLDENGERTMIPYDSAGYMDIAPDDKGENVRREICLTLEQMGIHPALNGLYADFSPKPLPDRDGSGMHINISAKRNGEPVPPKRLVSGVLERICDMTLFLNPCENSYERLGRDKAPAYVTWSEQNRSQLIRIPAAFGEYRRAELRSPDPGANPYLAFALIIRACLNGLENGTELPPEADFNTFTASQELLEGYKKLPSSLGEAFSAAAGSEFIRQFIPASVIDAYGR